MTFNVRWNFSRCQPTWTADLSAKLGKGNEGVRIEAEDADAARKAVGKHLALNPFYLEAQAVKDAYKTA
jgi:hypothetical protein